LLLSACGFCAFRQEKAINIGNRRIGRNSLLVFIIQVLFVLAKLIEENNKSNFFTKQQASYRNDSCLRRLYTAFKQPSKNAGHGAITPTGIF